MKIDSYYEIGSTHTVCEDYALHGQYGELFYMVGADGCSSSKNTDLGAKLLCHITEQQLKYFYNNRIEFSKENLQNFIVKACNDIRPVLGLQDTVFDATLVIVLFDRFSEKLDYFMWGDGVVIEKYEDAVLIDSLQFEGNAPFYLSYQMNCDREQLYKKQFKNMNITELRTYFEDAWLDPDFKTDPDLTYFYKTCTKEIKTFESCQYLDGNIDGCLKSITICSDGLETFQNPEGPIHLWAAANEVTNYKNTAGEFVKRKMKKLKRTHEKKGIQHLDDLFCATMLFED